MRLIDADALIDEAMERYCKDCNKRKGVKNGKWKIVYNIGDAPCRACDTDDMIDDLENAPTINAEPVRHGHWIEHHEPYTWMGYTYWSCSECGFECGYEKDITIRTNYCPQCGAKLDSNDSNALNALNALEIDEVVEK